LSDVRVAYGDCTELAGPLPDCCEACHAVYPYDDFAFSSEMCCSVRSALDDRDRYLDECAELAREMMK
jgi:hypothetical protein